jgi:hypothetical protein
LYCSLYRLADCGVSVQIAENFIYGDILSDTTICDSYNFSKFVDIHSEPNPENKLEATFYDVYGKLKMDEMEAIAHQSSTMLKKCTFSNNPGSQGCTNLLGNETTKGKQHSIFSRGRFPQTATTPLFNKKKISKKKLQKKATKTNFKKKVTKKATNFFFKKKVTKKLQIQNHILKQKLQKKLQFFF